RMIGREPSAVAVEAAPRGAICLGLGLLREVLPGPLPPVAEVEEIHGATVLRDSLRTHRVRLLPVGLAAEPATNAIKRATGSVIRTSSRSHRATVLPLTPRRAAIAACVSPSRVRIRRSSLPVIGPSIHAV